MMRGCEYQWIEQVIPSQYKSVDPQNCKRWLTEGIIIYARRSENYLHHLQMQHHPVLLVVAQCTVSLEKHQRASPNSEALKPNKYLLTQVALNFSFSDGKIHKIQEFSYRFNRKMWPSKTLFHQGVGIGFTVTVSKM